MLSTRPSVLILAIALTAFQSPGQPHRYAPHDTVLVSKDLFLQGTVCGGHCHPMVGFEPDKAKALLCLLEDSQPASMMAVGYLG